MNRTLSILLAMACIIAAAALPAQTAETGVAPFTFEENGAGYGSLADAVAAKGARCCSG